MDIAGIPMDAAWPALQVIAIIIGLKIFARREEIKDAQIEMKNIELRVSEKYVSKDALQDFHKDIDRRFEELKQMIELLLRKSG